MRRLPLLFAIVLAACLLPGAAFADDGIPMYRLYNPNSGEHFYTANAQERDDVVAAGWKDEGIGWLAPETGDSVYRLYNPYAGEHHYTMNEAECNNLVTAGWADEGVGWSSGGSVPLYREYNPNMFACNHNYTSDATEHANLVTLGWVDEGEAWYGTGKGDAERRAALHVETAYYAFDLPDELFGKVRIEYGANGETNIYGTELEYNSGTPVLRVGLQRENSGTSRSDIEVNWRIIAPGHSTTALICYYTRSELSIAAMPEYMKAGWMALHETCANAALGLTVK